MSEEEFKETVTEKVNMAEIMQKIGLNFEPLFEKISEGVEQVNENTDHKETFEKLLGLFDKNQKESVDENEENAVEGVVDEDEDTNEDVEDKKDDEILTDIMKNMFKCFIDPQKVEEGEHALSKISESLKSFTDVLGAEMGEIFIKDESKLEEGTRKFTANLLKESDMDDETQEFFMACFGDDKEKIKGSLEKIMQKWGEESDMDDETKEFFMAFFGDDKEKIGESLEKIVQKLGEEGKCPIFTSKNISKCPALSIENIKKCPALSKENIEKCPVLSESIHKCPVYSSSSRNADIHILVERFRNIQNQIGELDTDQKREFWARYYDIPQSDNRELVDLISKLDEKIDDITVDLQIMKKHCEWL